MSVVLWVVLLPLRGLSWLAGFASAYLIDGARQGWFNFYEYDSPSESTIIALTKWKDWNTVRQQAGGTADAAGEIKK